MTWLYWTGVAIMIASTFFMPEGHIGRLVYIGGLLMVGTSVWLDPTVSVLTAWLVSVAFSIFALVVIAGPELKRRIEERKQNAR